MLEGKRETKTTDVYSIFSTPQLGFSLQSILSHKTPPSPAALITLNTLIGHSVKITYCR